MRRRTTLEWLAAGAGLNLTAALLGACAPAGAQFNAIDITGASYARGFALNDHNGQRRTLQDFSGRLVMLFFGYTQCPEVCPTSMVEMAHIKQLLGADGSRLQGLFVTVDPERDRPEMLKAYMENFDPSFLALVPSAAELASLAQDFKVYYKKVPGPTPTSYSMDHSAGSYVYDTHGKLRLFIRYGTPSEQSVADLKVLLAQAR